MIRKYNIQGMTCEACVARVKSSLEKIKGVAVEKIQLSAPQAELYFQHPIAIQGLQAKLGKYKITAQEDQPDSYPREKLPEVSLTTYKPLLLIVAFIFGTTLLAQFPFSNFSYQLWMRHFMAGFFLVFAFFKLLNIKGFAESYQMYDLIAAKWKGWGYLYPFLELSLGLLYLTNLLPVYTNWVTVIVLGISSIGVIQSNLDKRKIKCACLGDVFNLPMSTVTIVEDLAMVSMAAGMLIMLN